MTDSERLIRVIKESGLTAKDFAERIEVGQGTISNIAGGRNKPSLEVMQKVLSQFDNIRPEWLIMGLEPMYKDQEPTRPVEPAVVATEPDLFNSAPTPAPMVNIERPSPRIEEKVVEKVVEVPVEKIVEKVVTKTIDRVVIFYSDGTYEQR